MARFSVGEKVWAVSRSTDGDPTVLPGGTYRARVLEVLAYWPYNRDPPGSWYGIDVEGRPAPTQWIAWHECLRPRDDGDDKVSWESLPKEIAWRPTAPAARPAPLPEYMHV